MLDLHIRYTNLYCFILAVVGRLSPVPSGAKPPSTNSQESGENNGLNSFRVCLVLKVCLKERMAGMESRPTMLYGQAFACALRGMPDLLIMGLTSCFQVSFRQTAPLFQ